MTNYPIQNMLACIAITAFGLTNGYSQSDTAKLNAYDGLSLKDLLNMKIVSVSKKTEFLFDAPLSASVVTKEEIRKAGCTSIMEALRLVPGMIVREQTNGNYDIYLRGMDNVPPNSAFEGSSTTTLVMINDRPIYNYLKGGTFWETLPVDINDVEKIEIVRGPAAALYGPNAVSGVINIITRQTKKEGLYIVANSRQGSNNTFINNASIGYQSKKWNVIASANYQDRERSQTSYYEFYRNSWLEQPPYFISFTKDTITNIDQLYPDPRLAMKKYAGNVFLNYDAAEKIKLILTAGLQHSTVQKVSTENAITPLSTASSDSRYIDFRATVKEFTAHLSYNDGTQITEYTPGNKYDFSTLDANLEYNFTAGNLSVKPGLSYRSAIYDDTRYSDILQKTGLFNSRGQITTKSASLRAEYKLLENKLRLVAGITTHKFNYPDTTYLSYQFAATYKLTKKHLFRAVYSQAPRSSTIFDTYVDQTIAFYPTGYKKFKRLSLEGNKNIKLLTSGMLEFGYRCRITPKLNMDVEVFSIHTKNTNTLVRNRPYTQILGTDTIKISPIIATNLPLVLDQHGVTVSLTSNLGKLEIKPFVTLQQTRIENYAPFNNTPDAGLGSNNIYSGMGTKTKHKSTPAVFGGASVNYAFNSKINFNMSAYYYTRQTYYHLTNILINDGVRGIDHINSKLILNASVSYQAVKGVHIFCSGKNLLNDKSREFFRSDAVPFRLLAGLHYEF